MGWALSRSPLGIPTKTQKEVMDTVKMIQAIKPDNDSPAFFTPHPGSDLFRYCEEHHLSLIKSHDSYRRNATEAKIKGMDYGFLNRALQESIGLDIATSSKSVVLRLKKKGWLLSFCATPRSFLWREKVSSRWFWKGG